MNTNTGSWFQLAPEEQFAVASEKFSRYASAGHYNNKCRKWSRRLAHAALTLHPELREEDSLERYFVAKLGRERGYRGAELTTFVDQAYESGLAKFAIEVGMASGPRPTAGCSPSALTHLKAPRYSQSMPVVQSGCCRQGGPGSSQSWKRKQLSEDQLKQFVEIFGDL
jgi:hypothetical protein